MQYQSDFSFKRFIGIFVLGISVMIAGCNQAQNQIKYDRAADLEKEDYRRTLSARSHENTGIDQSEIPELQPYVATPEELETPMPLVSLSVNQTVPLRDILFELTEQAGFDIEMDPQIQGSIIFTARNRPFDEVIERISDMAGLRYALEDDLLRIQLDRPYHKSYKLNYVNIIRSLTSNVNLDVSVVSGEEAEVGSGATVDTSGDTDFWTDLNDNIEQILTSSDNFISLATLADPQSDTSVPALPVQYDAKGNRLPQTAGAAVAPILNIQFPTTPAEPPLPNSPAAFSINRQSGLISVYATERQHKSVNEYLERLRKTVMSQVLIEAKILEVTLTDEYASGINWGEVGQATDITGLLEFDADFTQPAFATPVGTGNGFSTALDLGSDINLVAQAISRFGTVRALSSPRLTVLNHQAAVLNVVENRVFFEFDVEIENGDASVGEEDTIEVDTEIRSVPEGVVVSVLPSIDIDTGQISMALRPTITSVVNVVEDPTPQIAAVVAGITATPGATDILDDIVNNVPELSVQEIDSIVRMSSGQTLVMGGLMRDSNSVVEESVPVLGDIPYVGNLFKNHTDTVTKTELVIFLKATLIPDSNVHETDVDLYKKFGQDRRPFKL